MDNKILKNFWKIEKIIFPVVMEETPTLRRSVSSESPAIGRGKQRKLVADCVCPRTGRLCLMASAGASPRKRNSQRLAFRAEARQAEGLPIRNADRPTSGKPSWGSSLPPVGFLFTPWVLPQRAQGRSVYLS